MAQELVSAGVVVDDLLDRMVGAGPAEMSETRARWFASSVAVASTAMAIEDHRAVAGVDVHADAVRRKAFERALESFRSAQLAYFGEVSRG